MITPIVTGSRFPCQNPFKDVYENGAISLRGAHVAGDLHLEAVSTDNDGNGIQGDVDLSRAQIGVLKIVGAPPAGTTDLTGAHATLLLDEPRLYLDEDRELILNGFAYDHIHMSGVALKDRLDWLRAGTAKIRSSADGYQPPPYGFVPQPFVQLSAAYRRVGQIRDARIILLHKNRARTRGMSLRTKWHWRLLGIVQDVFVGYGYALGRAFAWVLALMFTGVGYFAVNNPTPTDGTTGFSGIDVLRYPMELLLPGVAVGGKSTWEPVDGVGKVLALVLIIAGWLLGVTIAAGIARALKRD